MACRYSCRGGVMNHGVQGGCISFGGLRVDEAMEREVLRVLSRQRSRRRLRAPRRRETTSRRLAALWSWSSARALRGSASRTAIRRRRARKSLGG